MAGDGVDDAAGDGGQEDDEPADGEPVDGAPAGDEPADDEAVERSAKWRCEWCGKPHRRNDPPCDSCGHHKFERAVVPAAPETDEDYEREPVWVCPECGRQHQKNSPPCSRCGNASLERHVPSAGDYAEELGGTSYLDLLEPQYVLGFAVAFVALGVLVLGALGVVTLPGMDSGGDLTVRDVPGSAERVGDVELDAVESAYLTEIDDRRAAADARALERVDRLDTVSRFANQRFVKASYGDGEPADGDRIADAVGDSCGGGDVTIRLFRANADPGADVASADALADRLVGNVTERTETVTVEGSRTGVDVHATPDGRVFLTQIVC